MSAAPVRFTFDLDLGRQKERANLITEATAATQSAEARMAGYALGFTEGERSATAAAAQRMAAAAERLAANSAAMSAALDDRSGQHLSEAVDLAATIARKLAGHLIARMPTGELDALLTECLASIDGVPHLVIRCAPELADGIREMALSRIETSGFAGRLVVMGDPEIAPGDGRIEWVDGGLVRDRATIEREVDARITAFLIAKGIVPKDRADQTPGETTS
jgi:flagellar assembly protein FliH